MSAPPFPLVYETSVLCILLIEYIRKNEYNKGKYIGKEENLNGFN